VDYPRHGLNTRAKRLSLVAGYAAPYEPPRQPEPKRHVDAERPGELVCLDCFFVGRLTGTKGAVWQLAAIEVASAYAWTELVSCPKGNPTGLQTSKLAHRVARELRQAGWQLERVLTDNGGEFRSGDFRRALTKLGAQHTFIRAGRPQTNGHVEALHRLISRNAGVPPSPATSTSASPASNATSPTTPTTTTPTASTTAASPKAASPPTSPTVPTKWRRDEPHLSAHLGGGPG
jgi:transposase InsO family protein